MTAEEQEEEEEEKMEHINLQAVDSLNLQNA